MKSIRFSILACCLFVLIFQGSIRAQELQPITAENADQLAVIETLGRGQVVDAGWTFDGELLVVASATGLWLYDADDLSAEPRFLPSEHGAIRSMAINPTEPVIATGHGDGVIDLWYYLENEAELADFTPRQLTHYSTALTFNQNGEWLVSATSSSITIWDWQYFGLPLRTINVAYMDVRDTVNIEHVAISPDNKLVAGGGAIFYPDETVYGTAVYSVENGAFLYHTWGNNVAFAPDNTLLFSDTDEVIPGIEDLCFNDVVSSPDLQLMIIAAGDCFRFDDIQAITFYIVDADTREEISRVEDEAEALTVAFHPNGEQFVTAHQDGIVRVWDFASQTISAELTGFHGQVDHLSFKPDSQTLLSASEDTGFYLWDVTTSEEVARVDDWGLVDVEFSRDNQWISYLDPKIENCQINILEGDSLEPLYSLPLTRDCPQLVFYGHNVELALHPDKQKVSVLLDEITHWDLETGELIHSSENLYNRNLQFTPDGSYLVYSYVGNVEFFDYSTQEVVKTFEGGDFTFDVQTYRSVAFSADGNVMAADAHDFEVDELFIWDTETSEIIYREPVDAYHPTFSPDASLLAYGTFNSEIHISSVPDGEILASFGDNLYGSVTSLDFSDDGTMLAAGYSSGVILLWGIE